MRRFFTHCEASYRPAAPIRCGARYLKAALFAVACLAGAGFSVGEHSAARADDGGMMSFLLSGNGNGRLRAAPLAYRFDAPIARHTAPHVRKAVAARGAAHKRNLRLAAAHEGVKRKLALLSAAAPSLSPITTASLNIAPIAETKRISQSLALKAASAAARPDDSHLTDKTLRRGDIVATAGGLRVFLGAAHFPFKPRDFESVTSSRHIAQRSEIRALDRTLRGIRAAPPQKRIMKVAVVSKPAAVASSTRGSAGARPSAPVQIAALAYAPVTGAQSLQRADSPAVPALERVVRHIQIAPAARDVRAGPQLAAWSVRAGVKKSE